MSTDIPADIRSFLEKSVNGDLENYQVEIHEGNKKGEGYLGDFFFISLTNKKKSKVYHLAIKQAIASGTGVSLNFISDVFHNESYFYEKTWPAFTRFQNGFPNVGKFTKVSKHYAVETTKGAEKISLENLRYKGFLNHNKTEFFKQEQLEMVLRNYGQFHAISMAFRKLEPENFKKITDSQVAPIRKLFEMQFMQGAIKSICLAVLSTFDEEKEKDIIEKFRVYAEKGTENLRQVTEYNGKYPAFLHGDCWSNNIMFKYDERNEVEDLRLIDFQLANLGTVVYDLSYCIYASGSPAALEDLDHYLRIYHSSLSQSLKGYDLDPKVVYPFDVLKQEWKEYSKFGLILGILVNAGKFRAADSSVKDLSEVIDKEENNRGNSEKSNEEPPKSSSSLSEKFLSIGRKLVLHAYKNDYL